MTHSPTPDRVRRTLLDRCGLAPGDRLVAAVSGGADSVALACLLDAMRGPLRLDLSLVHLNHGLRGAEADGDEAFVAGLGRQLGLPVDRFTEDVAGVARERGLSIEMAGRACRHEAYRTAARRRNAAVVATGHTRDDRAETLLLRLVRGAGSTGLSGMRFRSPCGPVDIVRPLLDLSREEVEAYLRWAEQAWREDPTNRDDRFARNRVRHELMPLIRDRLNPRAGEALARAAEILAGEDAWLSARAADAWDRCRVAGDPSALDLARVRELPEALRRRVLIGWLAAVCPEARPGASTLSRIEAQLVRTDGSRIIPLPGGPEVVREYGVLRRRDPEPSPAYDLPLSVPGSVDLPGPRLRAEAAVVPAPDPVGGGTMGEWPAEAYIRLVPAVPSGLSVRTPRPGDRLAPEGMAGSIKLQDVFVNEKLARAARSAFPLVAVDGDIVWVPGYRVARDWTVTSVSDPCVRLRIRPPDPCPEPQT